MALVEHKVFGDSPILVVAPHEGVSMVEVDGHRVRVGEPGTAYLARLAAKHIGGACLISRVPRMEADFARDPALLGKGASFRIAVSGKRVVLEGHKNKSYSGLLNKFHETIERLDPRFILDFHRMSNRDVDVRLGFGADRRYIGGTERALEFKRQLLEKLAARGVSLEVLVSRVRLTGESEFILNTHHRGRKAALVEFAERGFRDGVDPRYEEVARCLVELALEWIA